MVVRRSVVLIALVAACGGKSVRYTDGDSTDDDDSSPSGGSSGFGGTAGTAPSGGASFTGGVSSGGVFTGGVSNGGTFPTGGTLSVGGTGTGGAIAVGGSAGTFACGEGPDLVPWDSRGVFPPEWNGFGNQGSWYTADDCASVLPGFDCTTRNPAITGPDGQSGWFTSDNQVCMSGLAAQVALNADGTPAYAEQWGFLAGFTLNAGMPWDANEHCVYGVEFQLAGGAPATIRVNLVTTTTLGVAHFFEVPVVGNDRVHIPFSSFQQGSWVTNPTWLDPSQLTSLEFHVFTNTSSSTPFEFCVSYVRWAMRHPKV